MNKKGRQMRDKCDHSEPSPVIAHQPVDGKWIEGNKRLKKMIIESKKETIHNMQAR